MPISTIDASYIQAAPGQLFLVAAPATVTGADLATKIATLYGLFYTDAAARKVLTVQTPWAAITSDGLKAKLKQIPVEFEPNDGPKYTIGFQHLEATAEVTVADLSAEKLAEVLSVTANAIISAVAASGKAARKTIAVGGEANPILYTGLYRYPSRKVAGEFDHILIPFLTWEVDTDYEMSKKAVRQAKLMLRANSNGGLVTNPDTGRPIYWIEDRATGAAI
jgi:hypothetical protein